MPFSVVGLKEKASHSFQNTKVRFQSTPSSKVNWTANHGSQQQQQLPPPRESTSSQASPAPPPSYTRPITNAPPAVPVRRRIVGDGNGDDQEVVSIDWARLSQEDKETFFGWLDEFFARYFEVDASPKHPSLTTKRRAVQSASSSFSAPLPPRRSQPLTEKQHPGMAVSHPPATTHGAAALDLAHYFQPSTHWDSPWYSSDNPVPPPLIDNKDSNHLISSRSADQKKTIFGGVVFSDLSMCWFTVEFSPNISSQNPDDISSVKRMAVYLPRPSPMTKETLLEAHETYGETIAAFAESFVGTGEVCLNGESHDLAHEAIKYLDNFDYVPKPVPSLNRTHGHLIFEAKATRKGDATGRWRGGDDRVRRGDIVEWRKAMIGAIRDSPADPDHTAIIVRDSRPRRTPADGLSLSPTDLAILEVVEQRPGSMPNRKTYDLNAFEQGEMWIYRPVSMQAYLGALLTTKRPPGVSALEI